MADALLEDRDTSAPRFSPFGRGDLEQSIPRRFAQQVAAHGDRLAVKHGEARLSYAELDRQSNRLAHRLLARRGAAPEAVVLLAGQGVGLVVAILAVLKAGKFYVPLDPAAADDALARQIAASGAALLLADREHAAMAERHLTPDRLLLPVEGDARDAPADDPGLAIAPDAYAYIFYTSGSTGAPKGVVDSHRNVLHNVMRYTNALRIAPTDRLSLLQAPHFSGAVSSLFGALLNGAAVFPFDLRRQPIGTIARLIADERITIYHSVPAIFERVVAARPELPGLRLIRLEGDRATRRHVELFQRHFGPGCTLVNGLGATETGITRQFFIAHDTPIDGPTVPLGYATPDMTAELLDAAGEPVAPGEIGEIAIRSRYLALGYWGDPELTARAFAPAPDDPDERLYRTGDLGRQRADGCLEYVGRRDQRVKLDGQWVDLEAIEAALHDLDEVAHAVASVRELDDGATGLVAYVVPAPGATLRPAALRAALAARLPSAALPAHLVVLDALPLTANFKVDRNALPLPHRDRPRLGTRFAPPRDPIEQAIAAIWRELLGLDRVGIHDDFFELGGDSLAAWQVAHLIEERVEAGFAVSELLQAATVAEMASRLRATRPAGCLVPIRPGGARPPFFAVHDQAGEVLCFRELAERLGEDRAVYGLRAVDDGMAPRIEDMAARYVAALRVVQRRGPYLIGGNCLGGVIAYEMAQQLALAGERVAMLVLFDTAFPSGRWRTIGGSVRRLLWDLADLPAERVREKLGRLRQRLEEAFDAGLGRTRHGAPRPPRARLVHEACLAAGRRYRPQAYHGATLAIRVGRRTNQAGWERLIDRLEEIELPLLTARIDADVVRAPYVDQVAALLRGRFARLDAGGQRQRAGRSGFPAVAGGGGVN